MSIKSLFFLTMSIILRAIIKGIPSSDNWVDKYKFLSMLDPSTTFIMASGFP